MDRETRKRLDQIRKDAGPVESTLIDEVVNGELDRRELLRRGTLLGLSVGTISAALGALGEAPLAAAGTAAPKVGGRLRLGIQSPTKDLEPHALADQGGLEAVSIAGEFLTRPSHKGGPLRPELATSWSPNANATVWRFKLRSGVKFQSGESFGADDVVATYERLVDPNSGSGALSAFKGVLSPGGTKKVDNLTVEFHLDGPTASFPYLTSSATYQAILLPAGYKLGTFTSKAQATGAFRIVSYTPGVGAKYERFTGWWGGRAPLDGVDVIFYGVDATSVSALLGGDIDLLGQVQFTTGRALFKNSRIQIFPAHGATHRQIPLRTDIKPFNDYRVRQAVALSLDRPAIIKTLFNKFADLGNDSPFAPVFASTGHTVPQRHQDVRKAKQLMAAAGHAKGFTVTLTTETVGEIPQLAQIVQRSVKQIGINMSLNILTSTAYFAGTQTGPPSGYGSTPWLNAPVNITDWADRPVPNVVLGAALKTGGIWNAAHYKSKAYDRLLASYTGALALKDQRKYAAKIETLLLHDTPIIFPYFYNYLAAGSMKVKGYEADPGGGVYLSKTSLG